MMKKLIPLIYLLFLASFISAQQKINADYEILYEVVYHIDSTDFEKSSTENLYLYSNSKESVFMSYTEAFKEEIRKEILHQIKTQRQIKMSESYNSNFPKTFYKDLLSGKIRTLETIDSKKYIFQETEVPLNWEISEETKEILDYTVQKATTRFAGRNYIAWFTLEIPIPDGPYVFSGLPGLIIELYDEEDHYHFTLKEVNKLKEERVFEIPEAEEIAKADFLNLQKRAKENSQHNITTLPGIQMKIVTTDDMSQEQKMDNQRAKRRIKENQARKNNLIELTP